MRFAVIGAGAMGSLVAARIALAGLDVVLLGRPSPHLEAVRRRGLSLEEEEGTRRQIPLAVSDDPSAVAGCDCVLVLVKAWATAAAIVPLRPHLDERATVVTLQNGLGNAAAIRVALGEGHGAEILVGVTSQAALREEPGTVRHTGRGPTVVGRADGTAGG
ncbi:MAG: 2-dehydropantoate 2-reductase, partial [Chloroflexota bacterium]|nr:2-dehydropantoate 2-reductase [Chloroflexota bacterium]